MWVRFPHSAPECYERPNGDRGLEVVASHQRMWQEVRASQRSVWPPPEAVKWYVPAQYTSVTQQEEYPSDTRVVGGPNPPTSTIGVGISWSVSALP